MKKLRLYLDTSVFGGCFDKEFAEDSKALFTFIESGSATIILSDLVLTELQKAPDQVRGFFENLQTEFEEVGLSKEAKSLSKEYLAEGILSEKSADDAAHVAMATVYRADAIVSWNFKHIVQLEKMKRFNQVNLKNGYGFIEIVSPKEVGQDDQG